MQTLAQAIYQTAPFTTQNHKRNAAFPRHNLTLRRCSDLARSRISHYNDRVSTATAAN